MSRRHIRSLSHGLAAIRSLRNFRRFGNRAAAASGLVLALGSAACDRVDAGNNDGKAVVASVSRGLALLNDFPDSLPANSGNSLRCTTCHLDDGTNESALPWLGSAARYPQYRARPGYAETMEQRVNECIARSLAGRMLHEDSREMRDIVAYMESLRDRPRPDPTSQVTLAGDIMTGRTEYGRVCAQCHGLDGEGVSGLGRALWGAESFSIGAGMARQYTLATFVRHNMPYNRPRGDTTTITDQQAADIAAFVLLHPRQDMPLKARDWPNADPPADAAYATDAARAAGRAMPPERPLLPRRLSPDTLDR